jgi:UDPglucose 6-dehydrogenase/UDP-N-acetyl-D-galactosamine dehydrogenase
MNSKIKEKIVCIIGLGYVGLKLAESFSNNMKTIGFDIDSIKINILKENGDNDINYTYDPSMIKEADYVIIAVPTPLTKSKQPDLIYVKSAVKTVGKNLKKNSTIILDSNVYPGVTEEIVKPILEKESGFKCGEYFKIGYSPERVNPGDEEHTIQDNEDFFWNR